MRVQAAALALVFALAGCGDGDGRAQTEPSPKTTVPGGFATLEDAAAAFDCTDVRDIGTGGNPGLAAFGVCQIGRHNIDVYLTTDRSAWEHVAEEFPAVLGPNWVIVCPTGVKAARIVHDRIGGELRIPTKGRDRPARGG